MNKTAIIVSLAIIPLILISGCTQQFDAKDLAKTNAAIKAFLAEYPGATITASYIDQTAISSYINELRVLCGPWMPPIPYWRVVVTDHATNISLTAWIEEQSQQVVCVTLQTNGAIIRAMVNAIEDNQTSAQACQDGDVKFCSIGNCGGIQTCVNGHRGECVKNNPECGKSATCGNGKCESSENPGSCPSDCGQPRQICGNGICEGPMETAENCPMDCATSIGANVCPDRTPKGSCSTYKPSYCTFDGAVVFNCTKCGCPTGTICDITTGNCVLSGPQFTCGNGVCEGPETTAACPSDCPTALLKPIGSPCTYPSECQSAFCVNGLCSSMGANKPLGSPCANSNECMSPYPCINGICNSSNGAPQSCNDGTSVGACSSTKPKYCSNNIFVDKCSVCGCPTGENCNTTSQICYIPQPTQCTPNWSCIIWSSCNAFGIQIRTCADLHDCNVTTGKPSETQSCTPPCTPNWQCTAWSECSTSGTQTRTCNDVNNCGTTSGKPAETQTCTPPQTDVVGKWTFNEDVGSTAPDSSGKGNHGTIVGNIAHLHILNSSGTVIRSALSLRDESYVNVPNSDTLNPSAITIEARINQLSNWYGGIGTNPGIVSKFVGRYVGDPLRDQTGYLLYFEQGGGTVSLYLPNADAYVRSSSRTWQAGTWYHIAATYDGSVGKVYVNGVLEGQTSISNGLALSNKELNIGRYTYTWGSLRSDSFHGEIDEVILYNRAKTASEILQDYQAI